MAGATIIEEVTDDAVRQRIDNRIVTTPADLTQPRPSAIDSVVFI